MEEFLWENQLKIAFMLISLYCNDKCIQICMWKGGVVFKVCNAEEKHHCFGRT